MNSPSVACSFCGNSNISFKDSQGFSYCALHVPPLIRDPYAGAILTPVQKLKRSISRREQDDTGDFMIQYNSF